MWVLCKFCVGFPVMVTLDVAVDTRVPQEVKNRECSKKKSGRMTEKP